jgi:hypothetical protein
MPTARSADGASRARGGSGALFAPNALLDSGSCGERDRPRPLAEGDQAHRGRDHEQDPSPEGEAKSREEDLS